MSRFTLPRDIYYGANALENLKNLKGSRAVLVLGGGSMKKFGFVDKALGYLKEAGIETRLIENVEPDPSVETVMSGAAVMREFEPDWIISMGGGSPIDAAKAIRAVAKETLHIDTDRWECFAVPTTSGTGSEVTAFSVITDHRRDYKLTVFSYELLPACAILDAELLTSAPASVAAACGIDAFIHAEEAYVSRAASPFSDAMAEKAMELLGWNVGDLRLPLVEPSEEHIAYIKRELENAGCKI